MTTEKSTDTDGEQAGNHESNQHSDGSGLSRRGTLAALTGLGVLGLSSQPVSAVDDHDHLGETWSGSTSPGLEIEIDSGDALVARTTSTADNFDFGIIGETNAESGRGVAGFAGNDSGNSIALLGRNQSTSGTAIRGVCDADTGSTRGIFGQVESPDGLGIYAANIANSGDAYGCYAQSNSSTGTGILGIAIDDSGENYGVRGETNSDDGYGIYTPDDARVDGVMTSDEHWKLDVNDQDGHAGNVIQGHTANTATDGVVGAVIGGGGFYNRQSGEANTARANYVTIGGGRRNSASGPISTIGGGRGNTATGEEAAIGGGQGNKASDKVASVGGGGANEATGEGAAVGGGTQNRAEADKSTVGGGQRNTATEEHATIGGGNENDADNNRATVSGGGGNTASGRASTVGGGDQNTALGGSSTVGGGRSNRASSYESTVSGGRSNEATGIRSTVSGGNNNEASGALSTVSGGLYNEATETRSTVGGGYENIASGDAATVPGGTGNVASGDYSFAAGSGATASHTGSFVWANSNGMFSSTQTNQFLVDAENGVGIGTESPRRALHVKGYNHDFATQVCFENNSGFHTWAVGAGSSGFEFYWHLGANDVFHRAAYIRYIDGKYKRYSDGRLKDEIEPLNNILDDVLSLRPSTYRYKDDEDGELPPSYGFVAQDVQKLFPDLVSEDEDGYLSLSDGDFAILAIQALKEQQEIIDDQQDQIDDLEERVARLED